MIFRRGSKAFHGKAFHNCYLEDINPQGTVVSVSQIPDTLHISLQQALTAPATCPPPPPVYPLHHPPCTTSPYTASPCTTLTLQPNLGWGGKHYHCHPLPETPEQNTMPQYFFKSHLHHHLFRTVHVGLGVMGHGIQRQLKTKSPEQESREQGHNDTM